MNPNPQSQGIFSLPFFADTAVEETDPEIRLNGDEHGAISLGTAYVFCTPKGTAGNEVQQPCDRFVYYLLRQEAACLSIQHTLVAW